MTWTELCKWKEVKRKYKGHERNWKGMNGHERKRIEMKGSDNKQDCLPKVGKVFYYYYPFTNGLSRFWAPMSYPLPQLTWGFNLVLFQVEVLQQNNLVMLVVFGFGDLLNKWPETKWKGHETDKEVNGHVRTWKEPHKSMQFDHSGGFEAA